MQSVMPLEVPIDGWTVDDLPDADFRYELVDGALLVTPPASLRHQEVAAQLHLLLAPRLPSQWRVAQAPGVYLDQHNYREPDLVVYDRRASEADRLTPRDVVLAVEVMSPGSLSTDRVAKPAQYAAAGISDFWRVELDPLLLVVHRLSGDAYEVVGRYEDAVELDSPVAVAFRLGDLLA